MRAKINRSHCTRTQVKIALTFNTIKHTSTLRLSALEQCREVTYIVTFGLFCDISTSL